MEIAIAKLASSVASAVAPLAVKTVQTKLNPSEVEKAIRAGIVAARDREATLPPEQSLFYRSEPDFVDRFLQQFLSGEGVLNELGKPLIGGDLPDVAYLAKEFARSADKNDKIDLQTAEIESWLQEFVKHYFQGTSTYLKFQVAKEDYLRQLCEQYDDVKFAGMPVAGQESEKCAQLAEIFVMPDVMEEGRANRFERLLETFPDRQAQLWEEQRQRAMLENPSTVKYSARELIKRGSKAVLLGAPGSGKTTLTGYFVTVFARNWQDEIKELGFDPQRDILPVPIRIRDLARFQDLSILDYLKQNAEKSLCVKTLPAGFFQHWLEDGRALILLDGLDEVANEAQRYKVVERIECFLKQFGSNRALITSRPAGYRRDFFGTAEFPHFELQPFDKEKIDVFIDQWYNSRFPDPREAERRKASLRKALEESERLTRLASNPLLLTIIVLIHRYQAILPRDRHKLYDKAVETLITAWDANKEISSEKSLKYLNLDDVRRLMERLAYWIHSQGGTGDAEGGTLIDRDELLEQLTAEIKQVAGVERYKAAEEAKRFITLVRDRTGLLNEQGQDCYAFVHKTFQEYLCAQEIQYRHDEEDFEVVIEHIQEHLHDPHWQEVLLLLVAQQKPKKAIRAIRAILERGSEYECWLHHDLLFASRCLGEFSKGLLAADGALVGEILQRLVALEVDKRVGWKVGGQVFKVLCKLGETELEGQALKLLKARKSEIGKSRLQQYQAALGEEEVAIQALLSCFQDKDSSVRWRAANTLGKLRNSNPAVIEALLKCLQDKDPRVRWKTAEALQNWGNSNPAVIEALLKCLQDEHRLVRSSAAEALRKLGNSNPAVIEALLKCLQDEHSLVRWKTAEALQNWGNSNPTVIEALLKCLQDEHPLVRWKTAEALQNWENSNPPVIEALLKCLQDKDSNVRSSAAGALGKLGNSNPPVIEALLKCLQDKDSSLRSSAAGALGKLGNSNPPVIEALLSCLQDKDSSLRSSAADALGNLGNSNPAVIKALLSCLQDKDSSLRWSAAEALGKLGNSNPTVIEALLECLQEPLLTSNALGELGKQSDVILPALEQWLQQYQDTEFIGAGIDALWQLVEEQ
ncbi:HEAT repeat domain-containing protein [Oscillatoria sp. FACHB-1406]|uniref:NACHT domain-containing protein n=1 Tax=Oscillatoria sp. FACHB-1406 TaxID=2692846 RepID=UPI0016856E7D|nr:HEAT repeat domain-containing protein [Oscillatoria sp. FACHB-1406]MBD2578767.1 HEAT repeat domain-containing protein [Oscillatoria sp. FACHB-1406]